MYLFVCLIGWLNFIVKKTINIQLSHIVSNKHEHRGCGINVRFSGVFLDKTLERTFLPQ